MGFTLPWAYWLKTDLRSYVIDSVNQLKSKGIFVPKMIDKIVNDFLQNINTSVSWNKIWALVVLNNWLDKRGF